MKLLIESVKDAPSRENFQKLEDELSNIPIKLGDWSFITLTFTGAVTGFKFPHQMGFIPRDVLQTSLIGIGTLTWNYASFDRVNLSITTTGACVVRAFIGTHITR